MSSRINFIRPILLNGDRIESWFTLKNEEIYTNDSLIEGLNLGFNTAEKESVIQENRKNLLAAIESDFAHTAFAQQVHKTNIEMVEAGGTYPETDALVTRKAGITLAIQVADCAAVLMGDAKNKVAGAVHAGWRGAVDNIVPDTLAKMKELGAQSDQVKVFISPCISFSRFEVGEEVAEKFPHQFVNRENYKKPHVDLKGFIEFQLLESRIKREQIETHSGCTISESKFYSYRREKEQSGRMMGIITLK